jgi:hypothetical protein
MYHNWVRADGTEVEDTCDASGKPLPFVEQLPRKNQGGRPSQKGKENVPENVGGNVPENVGGKVATFRGGNVGGNVNKEYDQTKNKEAEKGESNNNAAGAARPPSASSKGLFPTGHACKDHPAIKAFHELHNRYPNKTQMAAIIEHDPPIADWVRAIRAWDMAGHNRTNVQGMIDWSVDPSRYEDVGRYTSKADDDTARRKAYLEFNSFEIKPKQAAP